MQREPRWPAWVAVAAILLLFALLPERLTAGPSWITLTLAAIALATSIVTHTIGRYDWNRISGTALLVLVTIADAWALCALVAGLPQKREPATELLRGAAALWASNVLIFACWYWRLDAGGPHARDQRTAHVEGAFLFPQMTIQHSKQPWKPGFVDYLFLAFNTSTAFSPTDVPVLSRWAKMLMMLQSVISLGTVAIVAARAINVL